MLSNSSKQRCHVIFTAHNFEKPFKLAVDASDFGMGGVLLQDDEQALEHPVCYFSKKFDIFQRNYSAIEKEAFALFETFCVDLVSFGYPIIGLTLTLPLIVRMKNHTMRLLWWALVLQEYDLNIFNIKCSENVIAYALSRS